MYPKEMKSLRCATMFSTALLKSQDMEPTKVSISR
jgi:hypothetical protein